VIEPQQHRNAVAVFAAALTRLELARIARALEPGRPVRTAGELRARVVRWFGLDLPGFLNLARRAELELMAADRELGCNGNVGELRARLWMAGAELEAGSRRHVGTALQPVPIVLPARGRGAAPPARAWPRPLPRAAECLPPSGEPDTLEDLLDRADALVGVRLGAAQRNKGSYGQTIAAWLGVPERGQAEPDWRGEVELKTVPVIRDPSGWWRVKEDPWICMESAAPLAKLARVLWIARVADADGSPVLSWYYQERDARLDALLTRDLHTRPKGGAGATARGWYVRKRFFADSGLLRSLNG
jgi:hypothetical protein